MTAKTRKPTKKRRATRRRAPAPLGLRLLFSALQPDGYNQQFGESMAATYRDVPQAILDEQTAEQDSYQQAIFTVTDRDFPGDNFGPDGNQLARECPDITATCGFWAGVATAWHVLNAINGKGGAR